VTNSGVIRCGRGADQFGDATLETRAILKFGLGLGLRPSLSFQFARVLSARAAMCGLVKGRRPASRDGACFFRSPLANRTGFKNRNAPVQRGSEERQTFGQPKRARVCDASGRCDDVAIGRHGSMRTSSARAAVCRGLLIFRYSFVINTLRLVSEALKTSSVLVRSAFTWGSAILWPDVAPVFVTSVTS
jgi:hypothetical protein